MLKLLNLKIWNLQFKFACLLLNFKLFVNKFASEKCFNSYPFPIKMWMLDNFDYPSPSFSYEISNDCDFDVDHPLSKTKSMLQYQDVELKKLFNFDNLNMESDDETDYESECDQEFKEITRTHLPKRKREKKNVDYPKNQSISSSSSLMNITS